MAGAMAGSRGPACALAVLCAARALAPAGAHRPNIGALRLHRSDQKASVKERCLGDLPLGELRAARAEWTAPGGAGHGRPAGAVDAATVPLGVSDVAYAVRGGRLYRRTGEPDSKNNFGDRQRIEAGIWSALRRFRDVPEGDLVVHFGDLPPKASTRATSALTFAFSTPRDRSGRAGAAVGFPNPYFLCDMYSLASKPGGKPHEIPWAEKQSKAWFRGALTTKRDIKTSAEIQHEPRVVLGEMATEDPQDFDVASTNLDFSGGQSPESKGALTAAYASERHGPVVDTFEAAPRFKYLLNVDGVTASWRAQSLLASGSVMLLEDSENGEFLDRDLVPWTHYVPIKKDLSDLHEKISYLQAHDSVAAKIGAASREFARIGLSPLATDCYIAEAFRLVADVGPQARASAADLVSRHGFEEAVERSPEMLCAPA